MIFTIPSKFYYVENKHSFQFIFSSREGTCISRTWKSSKANGFANLFLLLSNKKTPEKGPDRGGSGGWVPSARLLCLLDHGSGAWRGKKNNAIIVIKRLWLSGRQEILAKKNAPVASAWTEKEKKFSPWVGVGRGWVAIDQLQRQKKPQKNKKSKKNKSRMRRGCALLFVLIEIWEKEGKKKKNPRTMEYRKSESEQVDVRWIYRSIA